MITKKYLELLIENIKAIAEEIDSDYFIDNLLSSGGMIALLPLIIILDIITLPLQLLSYIMLKIKRKKIKKVFEEE